MIENYTLEELKNTAENIYNILYTIKMTKGEEHFQELINIINKKFEKHHFNIKIENE